MCINNFSPDLNILEQGEQIEDPDVAVPVQELRQQTFSPGYVSSSCTDF
jgi:hypothetical protein